MYSLTPQAQMGILQHQVELLQQQIDVVSRNSLTFTSAGPDFSSVNIAPSTSQNTILIHSVTQQSATTHTPVTAVQYNSQQKLHCDISTDGASTVSQVHSCTYSFGWHVTLYHLTVNK